MAPAARSVTVELAEQVLSAAERRQSAPDLQAALRSEFPGVHLTVCSDDDVQHGQAFLQGGSFKIYLVRQGAHCLSLTPKLEEARGLVVAEVFED